MTTLPAMLRDLKAIGATNAAQARPRALMGRRRWQRALGALDATRRDGRIPATFEVIYGHAWKVAPTRTARRPRDRAFRAAPRLNWRAPGAIGLLDRRSIPRAAGRGIAAPGFQSPKGCEKLSRDIASGRMGARTRCVHLHDRQID